MNPISYLDSATAALIGEHHRCTQVNSQSRNDVWHCYLSDGSRAYLKFQRDAQSMTVFDEASLLRLPEVQAVGRVPEVVAGGLSRHGVGFLLTRALPGTPLEDAIRSLSGGEFEFVLRDLCDWQARLQRVPRLVSYLLGRQGRYSGPWAEGFNLAAAAEEILASIVSVQNDRALNLLQQSVHEASGREPCRDVLHGSFEPRNILIFGGSGRIGLSGVVDFEACRVGDIGWDLATMLGALLRADLRDAAHTWIEALCRAWSTPQLVSTACAFLIQNDLREKARRTNAEVTTLPIETMIGGLRAIAAAAVAT